MLAYKICTTLSSKCKCDQRTPAHCQCDWLPIEEHKVLESHSLTFLLKCLNGLVPPYLYNLKTKYVPRYNLRSINSHHLGEFGYELTRYGARLFSVASAKLWNTLPLNIRSSDNLMQFKCSLNRHLFRKAFY